MYDQELVCADCAQTFVFTASEQAFFKERRLLPPKRCKTCRHARKRRRGSGAPPPFPEEPGSGTVQSLREEHEIRCSECGAAAHVPFKPLEGRPVFCQACYRARTGSLREATDGDAIDDSDSGIIE